MRVSKQFKGQMFSIGSCLGGNKINPKGASDPLLPAL